MRFLFFMCALIILTSTSHADITRSPTDWLVEPDFGKSEEARREISGAACVPETNRCLVVNDEKKYAQFFEINENKLVPGAIIRLLPKQIDGIEMKEIDAEAVAYAAPCLFVTGSHGRGRNGKLRPSMFFLFCIPINPQTGEPNFPFEADKFSSYVLLTSQLRQTIEESDDLSAYAEQPLDENGVSIEGLAAHKGELLFGFRSPSLNGEALVMSVPIDAAISSATPQGAVHRLPLGDNVGIRGLDNVSDGVLILAGRSDEPDDRDSDDAHAPTPSIWFWTGDRGDPPKPLGKLPGIKAKDKAEGITVLEETESAYRALILFDGEKNGGPNEFIVEK